MDKRAPWYRRIFENRDRNIFLICFGVALLLWLVKALSEDYTHDYRFRLQYELPANTSFVSPPRETVEARLQGPGWELLKASMKRHFHELPIQVLRSDITRTDLITAIYSHLGNFEVSVQQVNADVIELNTDIVIERNIPVSLKCTATVADGFVFLDSLYAEPSNVLVKGPAVLVEEVNSVESVEREFLGVTDSISEILALQSPDSQYLSFEPAYVKVLANVDKLVRMLVEVPITAKGDTANVTYSPVRANVSFYLPQSRKDSVTIDDLKLEVQLDEQIIEKGYAEISLTTRPPLIEQIGINPENVAITLSSDAGN